MSPRKRAIEVVTPSLPKVPAGLEVPMLRGLVSQLIEAVQRLQIRVDRLQAHMERLQAPPARRRRPKPRASAPRRSN